MKRFCILTLAFVLTSAAPLGAMAKESASKPESGRGSSFFNKLLDAAGSAVEKGIDDKLDDFLGSFKGKITGLTIVERRKNRLILDVIYEGIKNSDRVAVVQEVLYAGEVVKGIYGTPAPVTDRKGTVRLAINWNAQDGNDDDGWGIAAPAETPTPSTLFSDQIRLALVRETHPERSFGMLVFDFAKY